MKLPVKLKITTHECGITNAYWGGRAAGLSLCFIRVVRLRQAYRPHGNDASGLYAGRRDHRHFLQVTFHESDMACSRSDNIRCSGARKTPRTMAGSSCRRLARGHAPDVAGRILCLAKAIRTGGDWPHWLYSDEHGHDLQRSYNYLPGLWQRPARHSPITSIQVCCPRSAPPIASASPISCVMPFQKTMLPHLDPDKLKAVQEKEWLPAVVGLWRENGGARVGIEP